MVSKEDHALGFARALHDITGLPLENCLTAPTQRSQRGLSRTQRRAIQIVKTKRLKRTYSAFILVDDVVTSGATLQAAFRALKKPHFVQALCLMDRRLVAE